MDKHPFPESKCGVYKTVLFHLDLDSAFQAFTITVIVLCFLGYLLVELRVVIQGNNKRIEMQNLTTTLPGYINALFAGVLLETPFVASILYIYT